MSRNDYKCEVQGQEIRLLKAGEVVWSFALQDLLLIGEETTSGGPYLDDHFLVLVDDLGNWCRFSLEAANVNEAITVLEKHLNTKLEMLLAHEVERNNKILWPEEHRGKRLFSYSKESEPGFSGWLRKLCGLERVSVSLDPELLQEMSRNHQMGNLGSLDEAVE